VKARGQRLQRNGVPKRKADNEHNEKRKVKGQHTGVRTKITAAEMVPRKKKSRKNQLKISTVAELIVMEVWNKRTGKSICWKEPVSETTRKGRMAEREEKNGSSQKRRVRSCARKCIETAMKRREMTRGAKDSKGDLGWKT